MNGYLEDKKRAHQTDLMGLSILLPSALHRRLLLYPFRLKRTDERFKFRIALDGSGVAFGFHVLRLHGLDPSYRNR